ncbi:MAG: 30S ribosomal protein S3 [Candidatus Diapherotrites archaeon]
MIERHFIEQGLKRLELEEYLKVELDRAGFTKSEIEKTPMVTRIIVNVTKPGLAIGKSGANIKQLTETIHKRFGIENPQIEIKEITKPELDAMAMANRMKALIERGFSWRSVGYRSVRDIMAAGAQGVEIVVSGKLAGKGGRKKSQRIAEGYMKKVGEQTRLVDYAKSAAYPKVGAIGIKVRIVRPDTAFPDKIDVIKILNDRDEAVEKAKSAAAEAAEKAASEAASLKEAEETAAEEAKKAKEEAKEAAEKEAKKAAKKHGAGEKKAEKKDGASADKKKENVKKHGGKDNVQASAAAAVRLEPNARILPRELGNARLRPFEAKLQIGKAESRGSMRHARAQTRKEAAEKEKAEDKAETAEKVK